MIERVHKEKENLGVVPSFYMDSYLLDVVCATNVFMGLNLSWHILEAHVHVYFQSLWENKYKKAYITICDHFLAHLYFIIFVRNAPAN
jgi:hypothetical protein